MYVSGFLLVALIIQRVHCTSLRLLQTNNMKRYCIPGMFTRDQINDAEYRCAFALDHRTTAVLTLLIEALNTEKNHVLH